MSNDPKHKPLTLEEINKLIDETEDILQGIDEERKIPKEERKPIEKPVSPADFKDEKTKHNLAILIKHWLENGLDPQLEFKDLLFRKELRDLKRMKFELEHPWK